MTPPERNPASRRSRVLLVEADPGDAELVQLWLRSARETRYDVWHVESLGDAEGCLAKASFELAMVDLALPDASGPWAFHALRERHPALPIIVFSDFANAELGERLLEEGAQDHLVKGQMNGDALIRAMRHGVAHGRLWHELHEARELAMGASRDRSELVAEIAQEVRPPIHTVLGMADLLLETELTREQEGYVRSFLRAGESLLARLDGLLEAEGAVAPARSRADGAPTVDADVRVLVVDDSAEARERVVTQLRAAGIRAQTAESGRAAVEMCREDEHDLVLMDVRMPGMSGLDATRAIRRIESETGQEPAVILAVTGLQEPADVSACLDAGCDDHLPKPVSAEALLEAVARHAPKHRGRLLRVDGASIEEIDLYLHERHNDLAGLRFALEADDLDSVRAVAIELERSGQSRGFAELAALGRGLHEAADAGDRAAVERGVADLGDFLREVKIVVG